MSEELVDVCTSHCSDTWYRLWQKYKVGVLSFLGECLILSEQSQFGREKNAYSFSSYHQNGNNPPRNYCS